MPKYAVVESVNMGSTHYAERIFDCVSDIDIENGMFGHLGAKVEEGGHIYKFELGTVEGEPVVMVDQPAWTEDTCMISNQRRDKFFIPANTPFRVRVVKVNDEFGITIEGFTANSQASVAVGAFVSVDKSGKLVASKSAPEGAYGCGVIERKRMIGGTLVTPAHNYGYANEMFEIRVIG